MPSPPMTEAVFNAYMEDLRRRARLRAAEARKRRAAYAAAVEAGRTAR